ncbi:MAG: DUF5615 family PIN-like protein [Myxococcales bacterium]
MKILCDENMPGSLANELRAAGLDAVDVRERNLRGANDDHVLSLALSEGRILVTMDLRRFGNLIATPPASTPGLVVVRMPSSGIRAFRPGGPVPGECQGGAATGCSHHR